MTYLTILNYNTNEVTIITIDSTKVSDIEEFLTKVLNFNLDEISYMVSNSLIIRAQIC